MLPLYSELSAFTCLAYVFLKRWRPERTAAAALETSSFLEPLVSGPSLHF